MSRARFEGSTDRGSTGRGSTSQGSTPGHRSTGRGSTAWFHCYAGIAGDMALGSLLDAGAELAEVRSLLRRLPFGGWSLHTEAVLRGGIAATRAVVSVTDNVVVRTHGHIVAMVEEARLPDRVAQRSLAVFAALAEAEARLHRRPVEQVHFHEVGGHDTIVDVVGTVAALEVLGVEVVTASPVATGTGMVRAAHGMLPNPAPAVVALLEGAPTWGRDLAVELTTPTGAAILAALSSGYGPMPAMRIAASGFGAGSRELDDLPNCTQVVIGQPSTRPGASPDAGAGQPVTLLEANVDDATGEQLAYAASTLLELGAHDAWLSPIVMKKGRPGTTIHVLCDPADAARASSFAQRRDGNPRRPRLDPRALAPFAVDRRGRRRRSYHPHQVLTGSGQGRVRGRGPRGSGKWAPTPRRCDTGRGGLAIRIRRGCRPGFGEPRSR